MKGLFKNQPVNEDKKYEVCIETGPYQSECIEVRARDEDAAEKKAEAWMKRNRSPLEVARAMYTVNEI